MQMTCCCAYNLSTLSHMCSSIVTGYQSLLDHARVFLVSAFPLLLQLKAYTFQESVWVMGEGSIYSIVLRQTWLACVYSYCYQMTAIVTGHQACRSSCHCSSCVSAVTVLMSVSVVTCRSVPLDSVGWLALTSGSSRACTSHICAFQKCCLCCSSWVCLCDMASWMWGCDLVGTRTQQQDF